jgi:hypothetical protein
MIQNWISGMDPGREFIHFNHPAQNDVIQSSILSVTNQFVGSEALPKGVLCGFEGMRRSEYGLF